MDHYTSNDVAIAGKRVILLICGLLADQNLLALKELSKKLFEEVIVSHEQTLPLITLPIIQCYMFNSRLNREGESIAKCKSTPFDKHYCPNFQLV